MEVSVISWFLSALPILVFLFLMMGFNWSGSQAGLFSWALTVFMVIIAFGGGLELVGYVHAKALLLSTEIILTMWSALLFYILTEKAGTVGILGKEIEKITDSKSLKAIFIGWLFPSFLQGMGGYGVPVAVAAPLLVSSGFTAIQAVTMASVSIGWAVNFGSMATPFQALLAITDIPGELISPWAAILLGFTVPICGFLTIYIADGFNGIKKNYIAVLSLSALIVILQYWMATKGFWVVAVTLPSLLAISIGFAVFKILQKKRKIHEKKRESDFNKLMFALIPYFILVVITLVSNASKPIANIINAVNLNFDFPELTTSLGWVTKPELGRKINLFGNPGALIFYATIATFFIYIKKGYIKIRDLYQIFERTYQSVKNPTISILLMVSISTLMMHTGMTNILATGLSFVISQQFYPFIAPFIGALGGFITGTNNNSNVLFGVMQLRTAQLLKLNVPLILASQTIGASHGSVLSPTKVIVGCSTVGLSGKEGAVMKRLLLPGLIPIIVTSLIVMLFM